MNKFYFQNYFKYERECSKERSVQTNILYRTVIWPLGVSALDASGPRTLVPYEIDTYDTKRQNILCNINFIRMHRKIIDDYRF